MCDTCRSENPAAHELHSFISAIEVLFRGAESQPCARAAAGQHARNQSCHLYGSEFFSLLLSPHRGGSCHHIRPQRRRGALWQLSIRARVTHRFVAPSHTCAATPPGTATTTTSLLHSHKSARISRNISPILRETWSCGTRLVFSQKLPPLLFLNEKREKKGGEGVVRGCAGATVSTPFLVA